MNYLKTIFITTILLNISTFFASQENNQEYMAYTTQAPDNFEELLTPIELLATGIEPKEETPITQDSSSELQEWNNHLATLPENWNVASNVPADSWKTKAFELGEQALEKDKNSAETLKSSFIEAINKQTTEINEAVYALIAELDAILKAKLISLESPINQDQKGVLPLDSSQQDSTPVSDTPQESVFDAFPNATENPLGSETTDGSSAQTSASGSTSQEQTDNQLLQQWNDLIATMKKPDITRSEAYTTLDTINNIIGQLKNKKTSEELKKEFDSAFQILSLRKIVPPADLSSKRDFFYSTLFSDEYQQNQQFEYETYQQNLAIEQDKKLQNELKKLRDEAAKEKEERDKREKATEAAIALAQKEGKINADQARKFQLQTQALAQQLAAKADLGLKTTVSEKEQEARRAFTQKIKQQTVSTKKVVPEQQGILSSIVKKVTDVASNLWYGASPDISPENTALFDLADKQEIENLQTYLNDTEKDPNEKAAIMKDWKEFQKLLRASDKKSIEKNKDWIDALQQVLMRLTLTHHIISIEDACAKVQNAFVISTKADEEYSSAIVNKIKTFLENSKIWLKSKRKQEEATKAKEQQERQERKEQIQLVQQRIKDEENRIEAAKQKRLMAAVDYKKEKQEWKNLLAQLSQSKHMSPEEHTKQTLEAIKKSHSLINLASAIPTKNKHAVSQKLKQRFTVALLDQQKINENNINIHHTMDQFNKEINKALE